MRARMIALVSLGAIASGQAWSQPCPDLPGAAALFDRPEIHVVWVGEQHGTEQMPAFLTDLACIAGTRRHPVIVALERADQEQADWNRFLASNGSAKAVAALTRAPVWSLAHDGRTSQAILTMADRLRRLKQDGRIADVRLIDRWTITPEDPNGAHRDQAMADAVLDIIRATPDVLVLVYSGNIHAMKRKAAGFPADLPNPAASYLPAAETVCVNLVGAKGEIWNCQASGCGNHPYPGESGRARGVVLVGVSPNAWASESFDAVGYTGVTTTASPPAIRR